MCFSAEASFSAAGILGLCGGFLVKKFKNDKSKIFLALIPCFFAIQQLSEGVLWEAFNHNQYGSTWSHIAQYVFMFFAYLFWPVWIPLAYLLSERVEWRKRAMIVCLVLGMLFYCYIGYLFFTSPSVIAHVRGHSIVYASGSDFAKMCYLAVVSIPILLSSIPKMWLVGLATVVSFFLADYLYTNAYASTWCFVSAIIFCGLYFVLKPEESPFSSRVE